MITPNKFAIQRKTYPNYQLVIVEITNPVNEQLIFDSYEEARLHIDYIYCIWWEKTMYLSQDVMFGGPHINSNGYVYASKDKMLYNSGILKWLTEKALSKV